MDIFNKDNKSERMYGARNVESMFGTNEEATKIKAQRLPMIQEEVQKMFKDYDGGGLVIIMNTYDKDGDVVGAKVSIMGIDKPDGLTKLATSTNMAAEEILNNVLKSVKNNVSEITGSLMNMLKEMFEDKK